MKNRKHRSDLGIAFATLTLMALGLIIIYAIGPMRANVLNNTYGTDYDPKELMTWIYSGLYEGVVPERDNAGGFAEQRVAMLKVLEQFTTNPAAAIDTLLNG